MPKTILLLMLALLTQAIAAALPARAGNGLPLHLVYSNDLHGETEPCG